MFPDSEAQEKVVRPLAEGGLSTREIAAETGLSQTTVVRTLRRINSGPQPIFVAPHTRTARFYRVLVILAVVFAAVAALVAAAALASIAWGGG